MQQIHSTSFGKEKASLPECVVFEVMPDSTTRMHKFAAKVRGEWYFSGWMPEQIANAVHGIKLREVCMERMVVLVTQGWFRKDEQQDEVSCAYCGNTIPSTSRILLPAHACPCRTEGAYSPHEPTEPTPQKSQGDDLKRPD